MNVHVHVGLFGNLEAVLEAEAVAACHAEAGHEQVHVRGCVRGAHFHGLLLVRIVAGALFVRVRDLAEVGLGGPTERYAHEHGAVAVAPANVGRCFLVRHEAQVRSRVLVAERGDGRGELHHAGDGAACGFADDAVLEHLVVAVLHDAHVDVQARTRLAHSNLRGECHVEAHLGAEIADHPLGDGELVGGIFGRAGEELDFVLLVELAVLREVAHFAVAVLDLAAGLCDVEHALLAEFVELGKRGGFVVASLVHGGECARVVGNHVVFEFAHGLEFHTGLLLEGFACLVERVFRRRFERLAVLVEETAEEADGREACERVHEGRREARHHVKVGGGCFDIAEQRGTIDAFAAAEDFVEVVGVVDDEVESLEAAIAAGVHEVHMADVVVADELFDVFLGELIAGFLECGDECVCGQVDCSHFLPFFELFYNI